MAGFKNVSWVAAAAIMSIFMAGCAPLEGYPRDPENTADALARLAPDFDGTKEADYQAANTPEQRQRLRDAIVLGRIRAYDIEFDTFERELYGFGSSMSTAGDLIVLILSGLAATTGNAGTKSALAAASAGIVGAQGVIRSELFYQRTLPALLTQMEANRAIAKLVIIQGLARSDTDYPLWTAYLDLDSLKNSGSIPAAVANITQQASNTKEAAQAAITVERSQAFIAQVPVRREIAAKVDLLSATQLIALAQAMQQFLPTRPAWLQQVIHGLDPNDLRLSNSPVNAKHVLDFWISNDDMTPAQVAEWQTALSRVTAAAPAPVNLLPPVAPGIAPSRPVVPAAPGKRSAALPPRPAQTAPPPSPSAPICPLAPVTPDRSRLFIALGSDKTGHEKYDPHRVRLLHQCMGENGVPKSIMVTDLINCPVFESKLGLVADCINANAQAPGGH
jgi:hypothetical protein